MGEYKGSAVSNTDDRSEGRAENSSLDLAICLHWTSTRCDFGEVVGAESWMSMTLGENKKRPTRDREHKQTLLRSC